MEAVGRAVQKRPGTMVAINLAIVLVFFVSIMTQGIETEMEEEAFFPDLPEADANQEISEQYTGEYRISILVRSNGGDLLTPDGLAEMFRLQEALESDPDVLRVLEDPGNVSANFDNPADVVYQILSLNASDEGMAAMALQMDVMAGQFGGIQFIFDTYTLGLKSADPAVFASSVENISGGLEMAGAILGAAAGAPDDGAGAGAGEGTYEGSGGPPPAGHGLKDKQDFMLSMTEDELKGRLLASFSIDPAAIANASVSFDAVLASIGDASASMQSTLAQLAAVEAAITDPALLEQLGPLSSGINATIPGLAQFQAGMAYQSPALVPQIIGGMAYGLDIMLTKDYRPENGLEGVRAKGTMLSIKLSLDLTDEEAMDAEYSLEDAVKGFDEEELRLSVIGGSLIMDKIMDANNKSMAIVLPIAFVLVFIVLFAVYRNGFDMGVSLSALVFSIIWVYGYGALMGYTFNPITTVVPVLLVGLGIDYGIHITMRYREELRMGRTLDTGAVNTVGSVGVALLLATITTMIAFLSNLASPIGLLKEFGILCAVGIFGAFFSMTTFVPGAKLMRDRRRVRKGKPLFTTFRYNEKRAKRLEARGAKGGGKASGHGDGDGSAKRKKKAASKKKGGKSGEKRANKGEYDDACAEDADGSNGSLRKSGVGVKALNRGLCGGATAAEKAPAATLVIVLLITLTSGYAAYNLDTEFNFDDFLPESLPISQDIDYFINEFELAGGEAAQVYILVKGDIASPEVLTAMDETVDNMADDRYVLQKDGSPDVATILTFMASVASPPETTGDLFSSFDPAFAAMYQGTMGSDMLPQDGATSADVAALYDWLFENKFKDATRYLHHDEGAGTYDGTVMRISVPDLDLKAEKIDRLQSDLKADKRPLDNAQGVDEATVTGGEILTNLVMGAMNESQLRSMIITTIMTAIILTIVFYSSHRSLGLGIITTIPVVLVIFWILGSMYVVGLSLNMMTITLASLTVGLGATYAIHVTHRFMEELELGKDPDEAARITVTHTGSALFGAMATTVAGFGILVFSLLPPMQQFGGITAIAILFAFLSCVFVLPTMLVLWAKFNVRRGITWAKH